MRDITNIDWQGDITKIVEGDPAKIAKQKVFFLQNGVEYDAAGKACNAKQVKEYYSNVAAEAQETADAAVIAAEAAQKNADAMLKYVNQKGPSTVAELTEALTEAGVKIPDGSLKADLASMWLAHEAA